MTRFVILRFKRVGTGLQTRPMRSVFRRMGGKLVSAARELRRQNRNVWASVEERRFSAA